MCIRDRLTAEHIIFCYSLSRAIDLYKLDLQKKGADRTENENKQYKYLTKRGSKMLLLSTISKCMESIIGRKISDFWALSFLDNSDFDKIVLLWRSVVKTVLPMAYTDLEPALKDGLKSKEQAKSVAERVSNTMAAIQETFHPLFIEYVKAVKAQ